MIKALIAFLFLSTYSLSFGNENLNKLNNLYLNGILDKDAYLKSLDNLGININNDIFQNLFDLFSNKTLDQLSYEKSLSNLLDLSGENTKVEDDLNGNTKVVTTNNPLSKTYTTTKCVGDTPTCKLLEGEITFTYNDNTVKYSQDFIDMLLKDPVLVTMSQERFKNIKDDLFHSYLIVNHSGGFLLNFIANIELKNDDFNVEKIFLRVNGKDIATIFLTEI